jgi:hypothetical protein
LRRRDWPYLCKPSFLVQAFIGVRTASVAIE